ncbi:hypothetical protein ElyMa_005229400 [Elysia marginata]|uniref:Uncharacterized protein n=1 Tax=Elysia marginata TaxID=1093978 RepID=A0AAV4JWT1_9GAST|nr:hypothetical protein ElyMa_005229400 [Elysia marginata]
MINRLVKKLSPRYHAVTFKADTHQNELSAYWHNSERNKKKKKILTQRIIVYIYTPSDIRIYGLVRGGHGPVSAEHVHHGLVVHVGRATHRQGLV